MDKSYIYFIDLCELARLVEGGWHWYKNILILTSDIFICNITSIVINQKYFKKSLYLIRSSTKIVEFDNEKFPKIISTKDGTWTEFLETDSNSMFSKINKYLKIVNFLILFISQKIITWLSRNTFTFPQIVKIVDLHLW